MINLSAVRLAENVSRDSQLLVYGNPDNHRQCIDCCRICGYDRVYRGGTTCAFCGDTSRRKPERSRDAISESELEAFAASRTA